MFFFNFRFPKKTWNQDFDHIYDYIDFLKPIERKFNFKILHHVRLQETFRACLPRKMKNYFSLRSRVRLGECKTSPEIPFTQNTYIHDTSGSYS